MNLFQKMQKGKLHTHNGFTFVLVEQTPMVGDRNRILSFPSGCFAARYITIAYHAMPCSSEIAKKNYKYFSKPYGHYGLRYGYTFILNFDGKEIYRSKSLHKTMHVASLYIRKRVRLENSFMSALADFNSLFAKGVLGG